MEEKRELLSVSDLSKTYVSEFGSKLLVLENINFRVETSGDEGTINSVLAPFGAGKTTFLRIIAGLEKPTTGEVKLNGKAQTANGNIAYIPEKPSSFPWLNVLENIDFVRKYINRTELNSFELVKAVGLAGYEDHVPDIHSTGFRFRISLARALAVKPELILLDDCFKKTDSETKSELYHLVSKISTEMKVNFLLATTNIPEAVYLSDKIFLMTNNPGTLFKVVEVDKSQKENDEYIIQKRREIEEEFKSGNVVSAINFSI